MNCVDQSRLSNRPWLKITDSNVDSWLVVVWRSLALRIVQHYLHRLITDPASWRGSLTRLGWCWTTLLHNYHSLPCNFSICYSVATSTAPDIGTQHTTWADSCSYLTYFCFFSIDCCFPAYWRYSSTSFTANSSASSIKSNPSRDCWHCFLNRFHFHRKAFYIHTLLLGLASCV